jgi:hypothetical protein
MLVRIIALLIIFSLVHLPALADFITTANPKWIGVSVRISSDACNGHNDTIAVKTIDSFTEILMASQCHDDNHVKQLFAQGHAMLLAPNTLGIVEGVQGSCYYVYIGTGQWAHQYVWILDNGHPLHTFKIYQ